MSISDKAKELTTAVMGTKEYAELKQAKSVVDKNRELRSRIEDFKKKEESLYKGKLSATEAQKRASDLNTLFENLNTIPEVNRFVKAEKAFNDMLQRVYKLVSDTLESSLK
ncbi:MAG TPA: YlbF family regulator [Ruminiclostridium sp.]|nr:YlbF family regulator [Ruminiclostridium sp.]